MLWSLLGTSWSEYVTSFDGKTWTDPVYLFRSDNTLDNRPALVSRRPGDLIVIESSDSRRDVQLGLAKGWNVGVWDGYGFVRSIQQRPVCQRIGAATCFNRNLTRGNKRNERRGESEGKRRDVVESTDTEFQISVVESVRSCSIARGLPCLGQRLSV